MVKKLNGFLLTRKLNHKCLHMVRLFSSAKFRCMYDHVKPRVRDFNPNLGGLFRGSFFGGVKFTPSLKLVRIVLETSNLARKYTPTL